MQLNFLTRSWTPPVHMCLTPKALGSSSCQIKTDKASGQPLHAWPQAVHMTHLEVKRLNQGSLLQGLAVAHTAGLHTFRVAAGQPRA